MITAAAALSVLGVLGCESAESDAQPNVAQRPGVLVAAFAHPDDELIVAPALDGKSYFRLALSRAGAARGTETDLLQGIDR
jgi:hypothetical protein